LLNLKVDIACEIGMLKIANLKKNGHLKTLI